MQIFTRAQMRLAEEKAALLGMNEMRLMENAGSAVAKMLRDQFKLQSGMAQNIVFVCGRGNNGGDGFVAARKLQETGCQISIILAQGEPTSKAAIEMLQRTRDLSLTCISYETNANMAIHALQEADIIVDAIYGVGFHGRLPHSIQKLSQHMHKAPGEIVSIDLPSGAHCDEGSVTENCVIADYTYAISVLKPVHVTYPAVSFCGTIERVFIGIPEECMDDVDGCFNVLDEGLLRSIIQPRRENSHKGDFGHVLNICGSRNMPGAAILAATAAARCGTGLVTAAFPSSAYPAISAHLIEPLLLPLPENEEGTLTPSALPALRLALRKADACLIGCGLGCNADTVQIVHELLKEAQCPVILDADGINAIAGHMHILKAVKAPVVLTPHPGEMARLVESTAASIQEQRMHYASSVATEYGVCVVLKGANTLTALPDGQVYINLTGNSGLAKGGSGDVLAGMMVSFAAQGIAPHHAAIIAPHFHGLAGEEAVRRASRHGMLPSDMMQPMAQLLSKYE